MRKKINIIYLIPALGIGGAEKVLLDFCRLCPKKSYSLRVVYWGEDEALLKPLEAVGVSITKLKLKKVISADTVFQIARLLKKFSADLLHTHLMDADLLGFLAASISRTPLVISIHSYPFPQKRTHCLRYRLMSMRAKRVLCVSETVKEHLIAHAHVAAEKIAVVYNGIDLRKFAGRFSPEEKARRRHDLGIRDGAPIVGNISRLISDKGQEYLLRAAPEILKQRPETVFLIVGDGELKAQLVSLTKELNIERQVIFTGTRHDIPELLSIMDIFVFPTFNEALGISVLEAMAAGKPVIAANDAAVPEIITEGREGLLVAPGQPSALTKSILKLLNAPSPARQMGHAAYKRAQDFSIEEMVKKMEEIYGQIICA